jgi:hypothetical protein
MAKHCPVTKLPVLDCDCGACDDEQDERPPELTPRFQPPPPRQEDDAA